jgi:hypothetical protein
VRVVLKMEDFYNKILITSFISRIYCDLISPYENQNSWECEYLIVSHAKCLYSKQIQEKSDGIKVKNSKNPRVESKELLHHVEFNPTVST